MCCRRIPSVLLLMTFLYGCGGEEEPFRKETSKITGQILIDGTAPATPVKIMCHSVDGMDTEHPTVSWCMTGDDGKFEINTYEKGDGVPEGDYALTFMWGKMNLVSMGYGGPDQLNEKYLDEKKSKHKFTVKSGVPVDLGTIELTTKDE